MAAARALEMTGGQRAELEGLARSHTAPAREVRQAKALLWATDGVSNAEIARRCASTPKSVRRWRSRFAAEGTAAVGRIRAGRGRPVVLGDDVVEAIVHDTLHTVPEDGSCMLVDEVDGGPVRDRKDMVARIWQAPDPAVEGGDLSHWNDHPEPFVWTKPAEEILDKVARGQATLERSPNPRHTTSEGTIP